MGQEEGLRSLLSSRWSEDLVINVRVTKDRLHGKVIRASFVGDRGAVSRWWMEDKMRKIILTGTILLAVCSASAATAQSFNYEGQEMTKMVQSPCSGKSGRLGFSMEGIQFLSLIHI